MIKNLSNKTLLALFSTTLFLSACLVFWVQPLLAKMVLPFLGGSPSVWNTCMMFFQGVLLGGYLYAHLSVKLLSKSMQIALHLGLLAVGLLFLPFVIDAHWVPSPGQPALSLTFMLTTIAALPLVVLSASAPLLQRWFSMTRHAHAKDPYFLYVASTLGSFCALLAFPFLIEPWFSSQQQTHGWAMGFVALIGLTALCGLGRLHQRFQQVSNQTKHTLESNITWRRRVHWVLLAFVPSSLLLGVTSYITTDIASTPLFWIVPFLLYLLTFVVVFARRPVISLQSSQLIQLCLIAPFLFVLTRPVGFIPFPLVIAIHLGMFFFTAMVCHGDMVSKRPHPQRLTEFYLLMTVGGFLGGVFNSLIAPMIFTSIFEYHIVYLFALMLCPPALLSRRYASGLAVISVLIFMLFGHGQYDDNVYVSRNFFGTTRVKAMRVDGKKTHVLVHGTTIHGAQFVQDTGRPKIISYYYPLEDLMQLLHKQRSGLKIAVAGLGAGVTACIAKKQDELTFFEIDPTMLEVANDPSLFTYLHACPPKGGVVLGDARIELSKIADQYYDVIVLDVFSSDAIPVHLLTQQAIDQYLQKLQPDGLILLHVSNRYLDLYKVLAAIRDRLGIYGWFGQYLGDEHKHLLRSDWVVLSKSPAPLGPNWDASVWQPLPKGDLAHLWTDDYSNIVRAFRWR